METRRFDELTVTLARGGSRRGVLRILAAGVLGALALNRSGALAKNEKEHGGGKPITILAKPVCPSGGSTVNCPTCFEARFGPDGGAGDPSGCCTFGEREQDCENCSDENASYCSATSGLNNGAGTCVTATCTQHGSQIHCDYKVKNAFCNQNFGKGWACCPKFTSANFGHCIDTTAGETC